MTLAKTSSSANYRLSRTDAHNLQADAGAWILELVKSRDDWEHIEIRGGPSKSKLAVIAFVELEGSADEIFARVDACAQASGQPIVRVAAFKKGARKPSHMAMWPVNEPDDFGDELSESDPRNTIAAAAGLLRQSYAFNQVMMNQNAALMSATLLHLQEENKSLREERAEMRAQVIAADKALSDREVQAYEIRKKLIRDQTLADGAATLVQAAATHISKMPANDSTFIKSLEKLIESMSDDQLKTFMGSLSGTQQALFVSILEKLKSKGEENSEDTNDKKGEESGSSQ